MIESGLMEVIQRRNLNLLKIKHYYNIDDSPDLDFLALNLTFYAQKVEISIETGCIIG